MCFFCFEMDKLKENHKIELKELQGNVKGQFTTTVSYEVLVFGTGML